MVTRRTPGAAWCRGVVGVMYRPTSRCFSHAHMRCVCASGSLGSSPACGSSTHGIPRVISINWDTLKGCAGCYLRRLSQVDTQSSFRLLVSSSKSSVMLAHVNKWRVVLCGLYGVAHGSDRQQHRQTRPAQARLCNYVFHVAGCSSTHGCCNLGKVLAREQTQASTLQ